nr:hypothetical protein [Tanacetum cinerariifolium]
NSVFGSGVIQRSTLEIPPGNPSMEGKEVDFSALDSPRRTGLATLGSNISGGDLGGRFPRRSINKKPTAKIAKRDQRIQVRDEDIKKLDQENKSLMVVEAKVHGLRNQTKNLETLLEAEVDMKKAVEAKNAELAKELESLGVQFSNLQVTNNQLSQQMDARLDKLSVDFDEELYPHTLTAIAGRIWVIGHDMRLAVMKCAES